METKERGGEESEEIKGAGVGEGGREKTEDVRGKVESEGMKKRGGGVPLTRSTSSLNTFTSARKLSLRRHQTTDVKRPATVAAGTSGSKYQLMISPPDPQRKRTGYKQTTVYEYLSPQGATSRTGGGFKDDVFLFIHLSCLGWSARVGESMEH